MVEAFRSIFYAAFGSVWMPGRRNDETTHKIGAYPVDYSEPSQEEVDAANKSCEKLFEKGNWVPVNRKS